MVDRVGDDVVDAAHRFGREQGHPEFDPADLMDVIGRRAVRGPDNEFLGHLYECDQDDRSGDVLSPSAGANDHDRRQRVLAEIRAARVRTAEDRFHAAVVLQHGARPEHYELAHLLADSASDAGLRPARWLAAATLDRWLMSRGLLQRFGTQYVSADTEWRLYRYESGTTDEERAAWDVPPLDEAMARLEEMNARSARP